MSSDHRYLQVIAKRSPSAEQSCQFYLRSPAVGLWLSQLQPGQIVVPGMRLGLLNVLGIIHEVIAPAGASGRVEEVSTIASGLQGVAYDSKLFLLDSQSLDPIVPKDTHSKQSTAEDGHHLVFRAPTSGRYYLASGPGKPAFIQVGDVISTGHTVGLLEVMKTFNRIHYGGENLPTTARVLKIFPDNGQDINRGDILLQIEPVKNSTQ